ncbi:hypothetical protein L665_03986 [Ralstonia solanacearum SD54]|nr:hypothetical protein F504_156 [Ralstonia pseudosolanacearum FQY_4]ANH34641.1 hypothetical protein A3768_3525 [Ralstonia solanacearum]ESS48013.1 hypothetical protein L665_03986 [Ralstonia solanacearum SD54]
MAAPGGRVMAASVLADGGVNTTEVPHCNVGDVAMQQV